ncbi:MAG: hypothetical protein ACHQAR_04530, partial [Steroidobacterales bacterium]
MIMKLCHRAASFLALLSVAAGALAAAPVYSPREPQREDSNALIMTAEIALRRDNCGRAADSYAIAAQRLADVRLAARATEVALDCGQFSVAERTVARWRELAPAEPATLHAAMRAQLGLYKIDEARNTFQTWLRSANTTREHGAADEITQLAQQSGASSTFAMVRTVDEQSLRQPTSQLALAALAFDNWNYRAALQYAQRALGSGAARGATEALIARAHAGLGEADAALEAAQAARTAAPDEQGFVPVDVLLTLGREADARKTLEGLAGNDKLRALAARRLALLAFSRGDYDEAESRFTDLINDRQAEAVAVFYLSAIAERRGNDLAALRGYQLLDGTALEAAARTRAAAILYKNNEPDQALQMLAAADDASIAAHLEAEIAQAQLLSAQGAANEALARI